MIQEHWLPSVPNPHQVAEGAGCAVRVRELGAGRHAAERRRDGRVCQDARGQARQRVARVQHLLRCHLQNFEHVCGISTIMELSTVGEISTILLRGPYVRWRLDT